MNFNTRQLNIINATEPKILCLAAAASGKAIPVDTILPTPDGPKEAGSIKIGDYLFDRNGKPTKVIGVYPQGKKEVYEITFGDGRKAKCCNEHIWYVHKRTWKNDVFREMTVNELLKENLINNDRAAVFSIPTSKAVEYPEIDYLIPPYVIGAMLGDGCCTDKYFTISSETDEIPKNISELMGFSSIYKNPANYNWCFRNSNGSLIKTDILPVELRQKSYEKSIPYQYKYGSIQQRLELIRGLMDTDGSITKDKRENHFATATVSFTSTSYSLICDVKEVLGSLGYVSTISIDNRVDKYTKKICYSLLLNIPNSEKYKLFKLNRKKEIALSVKDRKQSRRYDRTSIRKIESLGYETEMICFEVDNSEHLYLMNDFIVTHNTAVLTARVKHLIDSGVEQKDIVAITFTNLAAKEMKKRLGDIVDDEMFIGTVHSYALKICGLNEISMYNAIKEEEYDEILRTAASLPTSRFPKIQHLLVDESQDLTALEYSFIDKIPTENIFYCGDPRQNIFQFRGGSDRFIINKYNDIEYKNYFLNINYRNAPNILNFANSLIASSKKYGLEDVPIKKLDGICERVSFNEALLELEDSGNWGAWAILARTNNEVDLIQKILEGKDIPSITFKKSDFDNPDQIDAAMLNNAIKVLTQHSSKGLEFPNVIGVGSKVYNEAERNLAYVTATRAMNALYWCPTLPGARGRRGGFTKTKKEFLENDSQMIEF